MLVLSRCKGESIILTVPPSDKPTEIVVMLVRNRVGNSKCRLGFDAPREVHIVREELRVTEHPEKPA